MLVIETKSASFVSKTITPQNTSPIECGCNAYYGSDGYEVGDCSAFPSCQDSNQTACVACPGFTESYCKTHLTDPNCLCLTYSVSVTCCGGHLSPQKTCRVDNFQKVCSDFSVISLPYKTDIEITSDGTCANLCCHKTISVPNSLCSGGGGGSCTTCNLSNLATNYKGTNHTCNMYSAEDVTVTIGDTFNLQYNYNGTGSGYPYERRTLAREIAGGGSAALLNCINTEDVTECGSFGNSFQGLSCPTTPGTYDFKLACNPESSSGQSCSADILPYFRCRVKCVSAQAPSVGFVKFYLPSTGIIKLNLISATDAIARRFGTVKVARWAGDKAAAADLGETKPLDPLYSPVRIFTGLGGSAGVKTWKRLP